MKNARNGCPITRLRTYTGKWELLTAGITALVAQRLFRRDAVYERRSLQRTFLVGWFEAKKGVLSSIDPHSSCSAGNIEGISAHIWENFFHSGNQDAAIMVLRGVRQLISNSMEEYIQESSQGKYGLVQQINSRILSQIASKTSKNIKPNPEVEIDMIFDIAIVCLLTFSACFNRVPNGEERAMFLRFMGDVASSFLPLQKRDFNVAYAAFDESIGDDKGKQLLPIKITGIESGKIVWDYTDLYHVKKQGIEESGEKDYLAYTDITTSCPAAAGGIIPFLVNSLGGIVLDIVEKIRKEKTAML